MCTLYDVHATTKELTLYINEFTCFFSLSLCLCLLGCVSFCTFSVSFFNVLHVLPLHKFYEHQNHKLMHIIHSVNYRFQCLQRLRIYNNCFHILKWKQCKERCVRRITLLFQKCVILIACSSQSFTHFGSQKRTLTHTSSSLSSSSCTSHQLNNVSIVEPVATLNRSAIHHIKIRNLMKRK